MNLPRRTSRIDFDRLDINQIIRIVSSGGSVESLTEAEREYYGLMEMVRGLRARMLQPGGDRLVTKAGIIKLLRQQYGLTDWSARRLYDDTINFFYADDTVSPRAWSNLYAEKLEKMADLCFQTNRIKEGRQLLTDAAKLRGCYDAQEQEIPQELLDRQPTIVYTADAADLGAPKADRRELDAFINAVPDIPEITRERLREDAGIKKRDLLKRLTEDVKEFTEDTD